MGAAAGVELVSDLKQARLVWESEQRGIPCHAWENETQGGYDSPIVGGGLVIIGYFLGRGDILDTTVGTKQKDPVKLRQVQAVAADDIVLAIDAKTGKTAWKRVLGEGINLYQRRKRGPHNSPCYHNGKVFAQSTLGRVYCLNAADGKTLWEAAVPATEHNEEVLAAYKKTGRQHAYRGAIPPELQGLREPTLFMCPLQIADGVVVADGGSGAVAFDAANGKQLWTKGLSKPLVWRHDGKELIIAGAQCVEPRTGNVLWKTGAATGMPVFGDGYLVNPSKAGVQCFRIGAAAPEKVWELPGGARAHNLVILGGHLYYGPGGKEDGGKLQCVALATGKVVATADLQDVGGGNFNQYSCLCAMDGRLVARVEHSSDGKAVMLKADPRDFRFLGAVAKNVTWATCLSAAVADGFLYTRGGESLFCYELRKAK